MNHSPITQSYAIETLSPVHVGSGREFLAGVDFYVNNGRTIFPDMQDLFEEVSRDKHMLKAFTELDRSSDVGKLIRDFRLQNYVRTQKTYEFACNDRGIREQLRDGNGILYIPGSSLKGSIRTVIFKRSFEGLDPQAKQNKLHSASKVNVEKSLFGDSAFTDIMKCLLITDAFFEEKDIELCQSRIMSLKENGGWAYKNFGNTLEVLSTNSRSSLHLKIDFSKRHPESASFAAKLPDNIKTMNRWINEHSRHLIEREIAFIRENDPKHELEALLAFYNNLRSAIPEPEEGCLLRLGWGMGYMTVSGDIFENYNDRLIEIVNDGRNKMRRQQYRNWKIFPKTRKLAMSGNTATASCGWIKMTGAQQ